MFRHKSRKMIYRILLLVLMDVLIITLSGPLAIYVRYNLFFEPRAIEFIENIFRYLPINLIITIAAFYAFRLYQGIWRYASASDLVNIIIKLSFHVFFYPDFWDFYIPVYVPDSGIYPAEKGRPDPHREEKYHDRRRRGSGQYLAERASEQPVQRTVCMLSGG